LKNNDFQKIYENVGYTFQALGGLFVFLYIDYRIKEVDFIVLTKIENILIMVFVLGIVKIAFHTFFVFMGEANPSVKNTNKKNK